MIYGVWDECLLVPDRRPHSWSPRVPPSEQPAAAAGGKDDDERAAGDERRGGNATRGRILYRGRPRVVGPASARLRIHRLICYDTYVSVLVLRIIDGRDPIDIDHVRRRRKRGPVPQCTTNYNRIPIKNYNGIKCWLNPVFNIQLRNCLPFHPPPTKTVHFFWKQTVHF